MYLSRGPAHRPGKPQRQSLFSIKYGRSRQVGQAATRPVQDWDDHRYYHHNRINQCLHLASASVKVEYNLRRVAQSREPQS
jgi:hypothetical protein